MALHRRVADEMKSAVAEGVYAVGSSLPSESELAQRYGVSRGTIRQAFALLVAEGVVASRQGARRVVVADTRTQSFGQLHSFSLWARSIGAVPSGRVVRLERRPATAVEVGQLELSAGDLVFFLTRLRLLDDLPVMIERTAYPDRIGELITATAAESGSLTDQIEAHGFVFAQAEHVIDAVAATAEDARLLEVGRRAPLLRARRRTRDPSGLVLESSEDRYAADAVAFLVHNSAEVNTMSRFTSS